MTSPMSDFEQSVEAPALVQIARPGAQAYLALAGLSILFFLITAGTFTSLGVALPDMVAQLGWSWSRAGLGYTLLALACGLASYAPTVLVRSLGVRATLLAGGMFMGVGFLLMSLAVAVQLYWIGAILIGVGFALTAIIPGTFVLSRTFSHSSTAIGFYYTAGALGGVAGPVLYRLVRAAGEGWRDYWQILAAAVTVAAIGAALAIDRRADAQARQPEPVDPTAADGGWRVSAALRTPQFWIITAAYTAYLLCETSLNGLSAAHLTSRGMTPALAAAMLSLQALVNVAARAGAGWLADRIAPRLLAIAALALVTVGIATLAVGKGEMVVALAVTAVGIGYGVSYLATTVMLLNAFGKARNLELMSLMCLVSTVAAAGPFIGGLVKDASGGFAPAFQLFAGVCAIVLVGLVWMKPAQRLSV